MYSNRRDGKLNERGSSPYVAYCPSRLFVRLLLLLLLLDDHFILHYIFLNNRNLHHIIHWQLWSLGVVSARNSALQRLNRFVAATSSNRCNLLDTRPIFDDRYIGTSVNNPTSHVVIEIGHIHHIVTRTIHHRFSSYVVLKTISQLRYQLLGADIFKSCTSSFHDESKVRNNNTVRRDRLAILSSREKRR